MSRFQLIFGRVIFGSLELRRAASRQEGQALIEYALIVSLVAIVALGVLQTTGLNIKTLLNKTAADV